MRLFILLLLGSFCGAALANDDCSRAFAEMDQAQAAPGTSLQVTQDLLQQKSTAEVLAMIDPKAFQNASAELRLVCEQMDKLPVAERLLAVRKFVAMNSRERGSLAKRWINEAGGVKQCK